MSSIYNKTCKLPIVGSDLLCTVNSEWSRRSVKLLILHNNEAWSGKFQVGQDEDTVELLDQLSITEDEYFEETKRVLTTHGGAEGYTYSLDSDKFTWKKYVSQNMAIKIGYALLEKVSAFGIFEQIIDKTLQENLELNLQLNRAGQQNDAFTEENELLKTKLSDLIEKKKEMEGSLYSQFVYLLNEKKRRINELQKQLQPDMKEDNIRDKGQSDSDPFGSDTELDSDEERMQTYSKEKSRDVESSEEEGVCTLPKRLRTPSKNESIAGPSGSCLKGKNNPKIEKSPMKSYQSKQKAVKNVQSQGKKAQKFSCVLGQLENKDEKKNSEDVFMFPKRTKIESSCAKLAQPSTINVENENDKDIPLDEAQKSKIDSDRTLSEIEQIDNIKSVSFVKSEFNDSKTVGLISDEMHNVKGEKSVDNKLYVKCDKSGGSVKCENLVDSKAPKTKSSESTQNPNFKKFSSSTINILNQLI